MNDITYRYLRGFLSPPLAHLKFLQILTTPFMPELMRSIQYFFIEEKKFKLIYGAV